MSISPCDFERFDVSGCDLVEVGVAHSAGVVSVVGPVGIGRVLVGYGGDEEGEHLFALALLDLTFEAAPCCLWFGLRCGKVCLFGRE